ncbi:AAA family ATPase [Kitasatospora sp. NPDC057500]|uniref:AAA family ATPase n=1 Tax=Kitasatospora sp. NPDC057500 TaxID=3346151 RepID=UPI0036CF4D0E
MRRFVLTGTPGSGKTTLLEELAQRGFEVVREAATEVIGRRQAAGEPAPWERGDFVDEVAALQRTLALTPAPAPAERSADPVRFHDRSPVCTEALRIFLGRPASPVLTAELERIGAEAVYRREVFFVRGLGFVERTAARRISPADALAFERLHEQVYRACGYRLIEVPAAPVPERADLVEEAVRRIAAEC